MKKITLLFLMVFTALIYQVQGQILFDYETPSTSGGFATWGDSGFAQIVNPSQTGINTSANVDASSLAPGIYITTITTEMGTARRKLIKQ